MITGLARGPQSAQHCFHLLKMNGVNAGQYQTTPTHSTFNGLQPCPLHQHNILSYLFSTRLVVESFVLAASKFKVKVYQDYYMDAVFKRNKDRFNKRFRQINVIVFNYHHVDYWCTAVWSTWLWQWRGWCDVVDRVPGGSAGSVSWDHIFDSLNKYFLTLRRETSSAMETSHMYRAPPIKGIKIPEQDAIAAVLQLTTCVAEQVRELGLITFEKFSKRMPKIFVSEHQS